MRLSPTLALATATALLGSSCAARPQPTTAEEHSGVFTLHHEHIATKVGPNRDEPCDIDADLYLPSDATSDHKVPAIIYSHGFGSTKTQEADMEAEFARRGYVVLAYTQLGHQGSGCQIHLDDPDYEGAVVSQLIDYLGGANLAFADSEHTKPLPPLTIVQLDDKDHNGKHAEHDPRVGMIGGSYGGEIQFVAAANDPRIDTIVPGLTWNDLNQELAPNYAEGRDGAPPLPGVPKAGIGVSLSRSGTHDPDVGIADVKDGGTGCAQVTPAVCQLFADLAAKGQLTDQERRFLRSRSVASFVDKIHIPVLLTQGQDDQLALSNEAFATYQALRERNVPIQLLWHKFGHGSTWRPGGEPVGDSGWNFNPDKVEGAYASMEVVHWFDHYLKDDPVDTGAGFSYYRDWADGPGVESAKVYGRAGQYPAGVDRSWYLSADDKLADTPGDEPPSQTQVGGPGHARSFTSGKLAEAVEVVGVGELALPVAGTATLFVSLNDVAPDGSATPVTVIPAPARFAGDGPLIVDLVGFAHSFAPGHRIQLDIAGSAPASYWQDPNPATATATLGGYLARLTLPTVPTQ